MVSARYAPYVGGTEIHTGQVAAELTRRGHQVKVLTTQLTDELPAEEVIDGVEVTRLRAGPRWSDLHLAPKLPAAIRAADVDLVHVQGYHTAVAPLALAATRRAGIPTAVTFHSGGHSSRIRNLLRPLQVLALKPWMAKADLLIAVSQFEADLFAERLGVDPAGVRVIPNGVSRSSAGPSVSPDQTTSQTPDEQELSDKTILSIGRLVRYKGHHRAIRAMPHVLESVPEAKLLILGTGPYEKALRRLAKRQGVAEHVRFDWVPADDRDRLQKIMTEASMAVLLSAYESHGMAAHEAVAADLPLVVMDRSALSELVAQGQAHASPASATDLEVAAIITRLLRSPKPVAGQPEPVTQPTWAAVTDQVLDAYRQALAPRT